MNLPQSYKKFFVVGFFIILVYLSYLLLKPFLLSIVTSMFLVYLLYPVYKFINRFIFNRNIASFLMLILIFFVIFVPCFFVGKFLIFESSGLVNSFNSIDFSLSGYIENTAYLESILSKSLGFVFDKIYSVVLSLPLILVNVFVMMFIMFYLFKNGHRTLEVVSKVMPVKPKLRDRLIKRFEEVSFGLVYGTILIGLIEGVLAVIGIYLFNYLGFTSISFPWFWALLMVILSILPVLGPPLIWGPFAIYYFFTGNIIGALALVLYFGILFSFLLENVIKTKIIGHSAKVHPVLILLGVLGGISLFGIIGLFVGPIILVSLVVLVEFYFK